jgi:hypothetical protein
MANKKHVALLKQGAEAWNAWRREHPKVCPDLFGAALFGADLSSADLREANLRGTGVSEADLAYSQGWLAGVKRPETIERQRRSLSRA